MSSELSGVIEVRSSLIIERVLKAVRSEPFLRTYHRQRDEELLERFQDVTRNLCDWLEASDDDMLQTRYRELARERIQQEVPLSEVVLAAQTFEQVLIDQVRHPALDDQARVTGSVEAPIREFFNRVVFSFVVTYEQALFQALLS